MATTADASPTVPSRRKSGSKRTSEDVEKGDLTASKRAKVKVDPSSDDAYDAIPPEEQDVQSIHTANTATTSKSVSTLGWSTEELNELLQNLEKCLPANDTVKYNTMVEKVDWEKVRFSGYSAAECKEKWTQLMPKLRKYRTLTELVTDARVWLLQPVGTGRRQAHPALRKKPLTPYFQFFMEKRPKYARENPDLSMSQLSKLLASKYQQLSDKKKQKYKEIYDKERAAYDAEMEEFKKEHPEEFPEPAAKPQKAQQPQKPQTPFKLFAAERVKRPEFEKMEKKEIQEELRKQWNSLSDGKRLKWIRRAVQAQNQYQEEVAECPGLKVTNTKPVLSKAEQEFKDKCEGKPQRPPNSGYSLFSRIMLRQLKNVPAKEKMAEISRLWKALSSAEREDYNKQAVKANAKYKEKYAAYLSSLPEEERVKLENEALSKGSGGKKTAPAAPQEVNGMTVGDENQPPQSERPKPKKPLSAMFFFQQEKVAPMREKHPDMSKQEIMRTLAREFSELPDRKKEKYQKMAEEAKQKALEETNGFKAKEGKTTTAHPSKRQKLYKGEPKKPPQSGYGVFSTEMLSQLVDVDPKLRMAEIAKRWNAMTDEGKEHYKNMVPELQRKYTKELRKFLENLSPEERQQYEEMQARLKDQRKGGGAAAKGVATSKGKAKAKESPAAQEEASSSSSSESSSEDDDSSSDDDDDEEEEEAEQSKSVSAKQKVQQKTQQESEEDSDSSSEESESSSDSSSSSDDDDDEEEEKPKGAAAVMHKQAADTKKKVPEKKAPPTKQVAAEDSSSSGSSSDSSDDDDDDDNDSSDSDSDSK